MGVNSPHYTMKNKSDKQKIKDNELSEIKKNIPKFCLICGKHGEIDAAHILPRSLFPEYYTNTKNIIALCRSCHYNYDNNLGFRQQQIQIYNIAKEIDKLGATRYFRFYE